MEDCQLCLYPKGRKNDNAKWRQSLSRQNAGHWTMTILFKTKWETPEEESIMPVEGENNDSHIKVKIEKWCHSCLDSKGRNKFCQFKEMCMAVVSKTKKGNIKSGKNAVSEKGSNAVDNG